MGIGKVIRALWICFVWTVQFFINPALVVERVRIRVPSLKAAQTAQLKIVHLTDIHFDGDQLPARISPQLLDQV